MGESLSLAVVISACLSRVGARPLVLAAGTTSRCDDSILAAQSPPKGLPPDTVTRDFCAWRAAAVRTGCGSPAGKQGCGGTDSGSGRRGAFTEARPPRRGQRHERRVRPS